MELLFDVPRRLVAQDDPPAAEALLVSLLEHHQRLEEARESPLWNRRRRGPFPEGYEEGWDDGQLLAFSLELARRLRECFVPPPPATAGG